MTRIQLISDRHGLVPQEARGWLQQLQVGQSLQARVLGQSREGLLTLLVSGQRISAAVSGSIQAGTRLSLQVVATEPRVTLQVLAQSPAQAERFSRPAASRGPSLPAVLDGSAESLMQVLRPLMVSVDGGRASPISASLLASLAHARELGSAPALRAALSGSGTWLEALLRRAADGSADVPRNDLKASLAALLLDARARRRSPGPRANAPPLDEAWIERALLGINANQLKSLPPEPGQPSSWHATVPYVLRDEVQAMQICLQREDDAGPEVDMKRSATWHIRLQLQTPSLGHVEVTIALSGERVSVQFQGESGPGLEGLAAGEAELDRRLRAAGFDLHGMECEPLPDSDLQARRSGRETLHDA